MNQSQSLRRVWTIGHSKHEIDRFLEILKENQITALVDVRTIPMSKMAPQFNEAALRATLSKVGINYIPMGKELGGRPNEDDFYDKDGRVFYNRLAESDLFKSGVERIEKGCGHFSIAIMCSEGKPEGCHRHLLVGRVLNGLGFEVMNILPDGTIKSFSELTPETNQFSLIELGEEESWKSVLPVRQESQQSDSFYE